MTKSEFKKFAQGLLVVKAKNSSFNSDFSGLPRRLPDNFGTIYATDKALKYCIRKYFVDKCEEIFVWRRYDKDGNPCKIEQNFEQLFTKSKDLKKYEIIEKLTSKIDVRLFGATYPVEGQNVSLVGTTQISYGINKFDENIFFNNQILSPYKDKDKDKHQTLGSETKTLEAHYVYDYMINPNNLINSLEIIEKGKQNLLSEDDVELFKEAMCKGISSVTSASKIGSDAEFFIFIEMKSSEKNGKTESHILPMLKDYVKISKDDNRTIIDLEELFTILNKNYKEYISNIELYYDDNETELKIKDTKIPIKAFHIVTLKEITGFPSD